MVTVTPADLGTYLGGNVDMDRAMALIGYATSLCTSVVNPLPDGSEAVILDVAARAYSNPANVMQQGNGPFSASYGSVSGGLWLTRQNKTTLRRLAGSGGAFMIDTMPTGAGTMLPPWDHDGWSDSDWSDGFDVP